MPEITKLYNTLQVANMIGVGVDTLRAKIRSGEISCRKVGPRKYYFTADDVNAYLHGTPIKAKK